MPIIYSERHCLSRRADSDYGLERGGKDNSFELADVPDEEQYAGDGKPLVKRLPSQQGDDDEPVGLRAARRAISE